MNNVLLMNITSSWFMKQSCYMHPVKLPRSRHASMLQGWHWVYIILQKVQMVKLKLIKEEFLTFQRRRRRKSAAVAFSTLNFDLWSFLSYYISTAERHFFKNNLAYIVLDAGVLFPRIIIGYLYRHFSIRMSFHELKNTNKKPNGQKVEME